MVNIPIGVADIPIDIFQPISGNRMRFFSIVSFASQNYPAAVSLFSLAWKLFLSFASLGGMVAMQ